MMMDLTPEELARQWPELVKQMQNADAGYKPFPPFNEWQGLLVDVARWERYTKQLKAVATDPKVVARATRIVNRASALDTGAIEGLYEVERGFTFTIAEQLGNWEEALLKKGEHVKTLFDSQLSAYEEIVDFATKRAPLVEAWIRQLHKIMCAGQSTYLVMTEVGPQSQELPKGEYKHSPNHVIGRDGKLHSYAPVDMTPAEMHRLCSELATPAFDNAHPVLQSAYAHYAFVVIHPFADGNGRVARALASVFTCRALSMPLMILVEHRRRYINALQAADGGNYQAFVDFVFDRAAEGILWAKEHLEAARVASMDESLERLSALQRTRGGYTHEQVDQAANELMQVIDLKWRELTQRVTGKGGISTTAVQGNSLAPVLKSPSYRSIVKGRTEALEVVLSTDRPAQASFRAAITAQVPKDAGSDDDILLNVHKTDRWFEARITELIPEPTAAVRARAELFAESVFNWALQQLSEHAEKALKA
jgi:Fic family protein